ncbi:ATP-grasp fold amidoligase family protein [Butyricicoccus sp. Marseille-Q5471]|uniref:ATP-grasp fold amidoligase family protein n=1 Tax=Butyricicoccus sp. Marseille-Q5471 TaxID=3039493 RepID=UPI0024BCCB00|nr:ATP-grasp fold amidoligase family protein [Butyricicoccus sp. Marseille-Q5471]
MNFAGIGLKIRRYITESDYRFIINDSLGLLKRMPDEEFLKRKFKIIMGYDLDLDKPVSFNEKMQWLKLHDRKPIYTQMVDKFEAKQYVTDIVGKDFIIPTYGVWDSFDDIDFSTLPERFVLKCTHDSGGLVICRDKKNMDIVKARQKINHSLRTNYYYSGREWPYKNVKPRIIAEKFMSNDNSNSINNTDLPSGLIDYKFYCFNGKPELLYVSKGLENHKTARISFLSLDWKFAPYCRTDYTPFEDLPLMPENYNKMIELAKLLSAGHSFLRVDLYEVNKHVYFSELTFSPCSGFLPFGSREQDNMMGSLLKLNTGDF